MQVICEGIAQVVGGADLSETEAAGIMSEIILGRATGIQIGSFLIAMQMKGVTSVEIAAFARVMRSSAVTVNPGMTRQLVDTCGTGGDGMNTFNISTAAAFVAAGSGICVVKHGNRSASGSCGSADVLEQLGVPLDRPAEILSRQIQDLGISFLFAPNHHPSLRHAASARQEIGIRSVFNILGPLTNPASADCHLLGVYDASLVPVMADVHRRLGTKKAMVVHGGGLDEITTTSETTVSELNGGDIKNYTIDCREFGFQRVSPKDIRGGGPAENAAILMDVLSGNEGPKRDIVLINAAAAIYIGGGANSIQQAITMAEKGIDSGMALEKLEQLGGY